MDIEDKIYCVYMHTNLLDYKRYIGVTKEVPERRWPNGYGYKPRNGRQSHFWNAICKYGWDNFSHEILCDRLSKKEAYQKEQEFITKYDTTNPSKGYNLSTGGEAPTHGCKHSDETKIKIGEAKRVKKIISLGKCHQSWLDKKYNNQIQIKNQLFASN